MVEQLLDKLEQELESIGAALGEMAFEQYRSRQRPSGMDEVEEREARLLLDQEHHRLVACAGRPDNPLLSRRLEVWSRTFSAARVRARPEIRRLVNQISDEIVRFRYLVRGEELDLGAVRNILRTEPDRERRRDAWLSFVPLSESLEAPTRELLHLRNQAAADEGFDTYAHLQMDLQGLTLARVESILGELNAASEAAYRGVLHEAADRQAIAEIQPWDIRFLLDGEGGPPARYFPRSSIIPRMQEWASDHGCDLNALGIGIHFMDIPFNGLCMRIRRGDIRILANPANGHNYYKTAFHELGHALHAAYSNPGSYILGSEPSVFNEGMAETMGYTVEDPAWLHHVGLTEAEAATARRQTLGPWFAYLRQRTAHALFEYAAYRNPDADLNRINGEIEARVLGCSADSTRRWAAEPNAWFSRYPVYWQNYVLADLVASQIHRDLRRRFGSVWRNREALEYIREQYWAPGGSVDWQEKIRRGTGEPLGTDALVADLTGNRG